MSRNINRNAGRVPQSAGTRVRRQGQAEGRAGLVLTDDREFDQEGRVGISKSGMDRIVKAACAEVERRLNQRGIL